MLFQLRWRSLGYNFPTGPPCAGTEVHDPVRRAHGPLVMLDDDDRVTQIAQPSERLQEPVVVALVQADAGFVQDIQDPHQPAPNLAGQADALRFPARQGGRGPFQGQVMQADVQQELQSAPHFTKHFACDFPVAPTQLKGLEESERLPDTQPGNFDDGASADLHSAALGPQAAPLAHRARHPVHIGFHNPLPDVLRDAIGPPPLELRHDRPEARRCPQGNGIGTPVAEKDQLLDSLGQLLPGGGQGKRVVLGQLLQALALQAAPAAVRVPAE